MAGSTSIELIRQGISMVLADAFPDVPTNVNPGIQLDTLPRFFINVLPCTFDQKIQWNKRVLFWDVSYVIDMNLPDKETLLTDAQELLDINFQYITVTDPTDGTSSVKHTYKRNAKLDLFNSVLHYTFYTNEWVTLPTSQLPPVTSMPTELTINTSLEDS